MIYHIGEYYRYNGGRKKYKLGLLQYYCWAKNGLLISKCKNKTYMLSEKKKTELYDIVNEEIMLARIKIWKMKDDKNISIAAIDDILSNLCKNAPQKAIDLFKPKK